MRKVRKLNKIIGIAALGAPLKQERYDLAVTEIRCRGYEVLCPLDPCEYYGRYDYGFACASAEKRAAAFNSLVIDEQVDIIVAARGGYGTVDVLPLINFEMLSKNEKCVIGCSDITLLLAQIPERCGIPSMHGATLGSSFADAATDQSAKESVDELIKLLTEESYCLELEAKIVLKRNNHSVKSGKLLCGNLCSLISLIGTAWDVDYQGKILVIEEVQEAPYRIERMLKQLYYAGKLEKLSGLVFARFSKCISKEGPTVDEVIKNFTDSMLARTAYPVLTGVEVGHWGKNIPLPLGVEAEIRENKIIVKESILKI